MAFTESYKIGGNFTAFLLFYRDMNVKFLARTRVNIFAILL